MQACLWWAAYAINTVSNTVRIRAFAHVAKEESTGLGEPGDMRMGGVLLAWWSQRRRLGGSLGETACFGDLSTLWRFENGG